MNTNRKYCSCILILIVTLNMLKGLYGYGSICILMTKFKKQTQKTHTHKKNDTENVLYIFLLIPK